MIGHMSSALIVLGLSLAVFFQLTQSANILAVFSFPASSSYLLIAPYLKALVCNGHQVTIISSVDPMDNIDGAQHIRVPKLDYQWEVMFKNDFDDLVFTRWTKALWVSKVFRNISLFTLGHPEVQALIHNPSVHFDMVIMQASHVDALYGIAQHFNAALVGVSAYGTSWNIDYQAGNKAPSVYEPIVRSGYSSGISLFDKIGNWVYITEEWLLEQLIYLPDQIFLYKHFFGHLARDLHDIRSNFSLMLVNHHFSLGRARSNVPNVIEVAGMHMSNPYVRMKAPLKRFLDNAVHGVIYMSMGMQLSFKWLPHRMQEILQQSFEQLPWHVVWKLELDKQANRSERMYISPNIPQRDLLSHPNVKLFITHGGLLSIIEAAHNAVPMLCLPMYYDQFDNAEKMRNAGLAQIIDTTAMSVELVTKAIKELIENPTYKHNAQVMSTRLRDQPMKPLETAVWWTEYVLRHKGAPHMRLSEQDMSFINYYSLDIVPVLFGRIGVAIIIISCLGIKLIRVFTSWQMRNFHLRVLY